MPENNAKARLYVADDLSPGDSVDLNGDQSHYLRHVMRLAAGDAVAVFNGRHGEWSGVVGKGGKGACRLEIDRQTRPQRDEGDLWLAFAPVKKARTDFLVEKATELGVSRLLPVFTAHSAIRRVNVARLTAHAIEAAEQCGRLTVPGIEKAAPLDRILKEWPRGRTLLVMDETGAAPPLGQVLSMDARGKGRGKGRGSSWGILTGPEGGLAPSELDALDDLPFVKRAGLGPRVLRAETAALAALACWQSMVGDWRGG